VTMLDRDAPLLDVRDLTVHFPTHDGLVKAVDGVSFTLEEAETLGVVGESGSGKSVTFMTVMGLINRKTAQVSGEILFKGMDLLTTPESQLRKLRGDGMGMVFQDPMTSLHPMYRVGDQIAEGVLVHRNVSRQVAWDMAVDALGKVGIPSAEQRARGYPHEFSGGMRQRAMIAMALVLDPDLLIADEPTTALDVTVQAQILELIGEMKDRLGIGVVLVSHNLGVIADVAQKVMIMYAGRAVEMGTRDEIFHAPHHPYAWGLLESIPRPDVRVARLLPIPGSPPSLIHVPEGCSFHPRCPHRFERCDREDPPLESPDGSAHRDACLLSLEDKRRLWAERQRAFEDAAA
jgi:peptide/nickel transport system ATP-binding protein